MNWQQLLTNSDKQTRLISPCLLVKTETNQQKHTKKPTTIKILVKNTCNCKVCSIIQQVVFKIPEINGVSVGNMNSREPISTLCDHIEIMYFTTTFPNYNSITFRGSFNKTYLFHVKLGMT